eukprot:6185007-Pleurochrysis_carterae.AAC.2
MEPRLDGDDRTSCPPKPTRVLPPPPPVINDLRRALHAVREEEGLELTREYTRRPVRDPAVQRDSRPSASSMPAEFGSRPDREATAAPVVALHTEIRVHVTSPPRTQSSIPAQMATNSVTRWLTRPFSFNSMSPHPVGAMRPVEPHGQVAFHYRHLVIFAQRMYSTNRTRDDQVWVRTGASISGRHCLHRPASQICQQ